MHIILQKASTPYLQIVAVFQINIIYHVRNHHSHLAKKVPSQNPPSNFNLHYFSSYTARVVNNKLRTSYTTFCVQHNTNSTGFCHTFQLNTASLTKCAHTLYTLCSYVCIASTECRYSSTHNYRPCIFVITPSLHFQSK